ncbi:alpha-ketoglutarate-dependent dioxygenase AlkB [Cytophaga sp. FL35]|uniref:alpha-ketoglutarate-dependent dioxygenase AlkB family protein n=1 Tax=Cytophaga sp. FL35 TaxID=1904456 RepID=UPI001653A329|nr:alpha-ketoglutarate-dependent dioxygenase AlkB [Cytophaga sp. FL35]MBC7000422.1 alpha-ketoglutarate-dependent dioxygenase AlkB [Cytophaga sp. FL35]
MHRLFPSQPDLQLCESTMSYYPRFLGKGEADTLFHVLRKNVPWQQDSIKIFGRDYLQPRLTALYANNEKPYSYSNITMHPKKFIPELLELKHRIEQKCKTEFTTCLLNLYRNGKDSNGWHADNEKELGKEPIIASVSLGAERFFHLKHRKIKNERHKLLLEHGSLLVMSGQTQHKWLHQVPKTSREIGERINLTFRYIQ